MSLEIRCAGVQPEEVWTVQHNVCVSARRTTASLRRSFETRCERGIYGCKIEWQWIDLIWIIYNTIKYVCVSINQIISFDISLDGTSSNYWLSQWNSGFSWKWKRIGWSPTLGIQHEKTGMEWWLSCCSSKVKLIL